MMKVNEKTDGELLALLLELAATTVGIAREAMRESLGSASYTIKELGQAEAMLQVVGGTRVLLDKVAVAPRWREVMVGLLERLDNELETN